MLNIIVTTRFTAAQKEMLKKTAESGNEVKLIFSDAGAVTGIEHADAVIGNIPPNMVKAAKKLKWLQLQSAGTNGYPEVLPDNVILTNSTGAYGLAIAEHMLGMLLSLYKKLNFYHANQQNRLWKDEGEAKSISGSTALLIGMGDIGYEFGKRLSMLGCYTIGIRRAHRADGEKPEYIHELHLTESLDQLLPRADIISLSLPSTKETKGIISRERLALMKPDAVLLNVGRGDAIDTEALCDALYAGRLGGAGLDVTDPEPLPENHRLWAAPNTLITPHISGGTHLPVILQTVAEIAAENLCAFIAGGEFRNVIDFSTGYRRPKL